jgi:hypothetical protein
MMRVTTHTGADAPIHGAHFIVNAYVGHDRSELMIRDYWQFPRRDASRNRQDFHDEQEPERPSRNARERGDVDWDRMPDPEALRWSPRAARREREAGPNDSRENNRLEGYGYGDSYFSDDQRLSHPRFQEGWEGNYRSAPWTLGAEQVSPGLRGPYGGRTPQYDLGEGGGFSEERYGRSHGSHDSYRRSVRQSGQHRGNGPQSYTRADERIREDICDRLTDDGDVDARYINVAVDHGVVMLEGSVTDRAMKYDAEECSWSVSGVKDVDNRIRVDRSPERRNGREGTDVI